MSLLIGAVLFNVLRIFDPKDVELEMAHRAGIWTGWRPSNSVNSDFEPWSGNPIMVFSWFCAVPPRKYEIWGQITWPNYRAISYGANRLFLWVWNRPRCVLLYRCGTAGDWSGDNVVGIMSRRRAWRLRVRILVGVRYVPLLQNVQTGSGATQPPMGTGVLFQGKVAEAWCWQLTSI